MNPDFMFLFFNCSSNVNLDVEHQGSIYSFESGCSRFAFSIKFYSQIFIMLSVSYMPKTICMRERESSRIEREKNKLKWRK